MHARFAICSSQVWVERTGKRVRYYVRMKTGFVFVTLVSVLLLAISAGPPWIPHGLHDTPETKSAFLRNYNPKRVNEPLLANQSFGSSASEGGGADKHGTIGHLDP